MDIIIAVIWMAILAIITGIFAYFKLKEPKNVKISKDILFGFTNECENNLDELIEFSKSHNSKYKI